MRAGLGTRTFQGFERGERRPHREFARCLADGLALDVGDLGSARSRLVESIGLSRAEGNRWVLAWDLEVFAGLAAVRGLAAKAIRLAGAAARAREVIGESGAPDVQARLARRLEMARAALAEARRAEAWEEGRAMTLDQALADALG